MRVQFRSDDVEMGGTFATDVPQMEVHFRIPPGSQERLIQKPLVNGEPPYLKPGLERDTSWSQQGTTGRLEKNGVILQTDPGRKSYLIADRQALGVLAYNPLPDSSDWRLALPDGASIKADGKVGMLRVAIDREANTIEIDHVARDGHQAAELAKSMILNGFPKQTQIRVNGLRSAGQQVLVSGAGDSSIIVDISPPPAE